MCTDKDGMLTGARIMAGAHSASNPWLYLCGPPPMTAALSKDLQSLGLPRGHMRWERFESR